MTPARVAKLLEDEAMLDWLSAPGKVLFRCFAFGLSMRFWLAEGPRAALRSAIAASGESPSFGADNISAKSKGGAG